ncbi:hypothetical protein TDMWS_09590 [Thermodesulfomicrobium sp. WS]|jgi:XXXCH domain-containing protein|uniref:GAK system XXXCH domain-containing protein n=1 Tax=Thermodesulfomicrobium sp. WS TaxID=3004129 RepID=UPI00248F5F15|nr:GAK system XXXCH domain-containing protein [Thermodesulfomicrobium sp. WS]BDV00874.1 hypothetical protein TDMWS_09590 [Thermodesulfomicrobium sp. WS]
MKTKSIWTLSRGETARFLRALATAIEEGESEVNGFGIQLAELIKFKLKFTQLAGDTLEVKFSGRFAPTGEDDDEGYSKLKKRMQVYWRSIRQSAEQGEIPSQELLSVFLVDARRMTTFAGYGDPYYSVFLESCRRLEEAIAAGDVAEIQAAVQALDAQKKACHGRSK